MNTMEHDLELLNQGKDLLNSNEVKGLIPIKEGFHSKEYGNNNEHSINYILLYFLGVTTGFILVLFISMW